MGCQNLTFYQIIHSIKSFVKDKVKVFDSYLRLDLDLLFGIYFFYESVDKLR